MRNLILTLTGILASFMFTGCSYIMLPTNFNAEYVQPVTNSNIKKTDKLSINIEPSNEVYTLKGNNTMVGWATRLQVEERTNGLVLREFLNQSFERVKVGNKSADLNIKTKINSFSFQHSAVQIAGLTDTTIQLHVIVNQGEKEILNKVYTEIDPEYMKNTILVNLRGEYPDAIQVKNEDYHRGLVWIYEKKFKPDLLEALKNNPL